MPELFACDLFAGAGGFSLGALQAGMKISAAVEWDKHACSTYRANFIDSGLTDCRLYEDDIGDLDPRQLSENTGLQNSGCDLLLGGPPCQGFSTHRIKNAGVDDPRNALLLRYFEYVRVLRPTIFLVENVPGMLWPRHQKYVKEFYSLAQSSGYGVLPPHVINARDFGVPQSRRRVFILGYDAEKFAAQPQWPPQPTHDDPKADNDLPHWLTASSVFQKKTSPSDPNNVHMQHGPDLIEAFKRTPINGGSRSDSGRVLPCHEGHDGHKDVYGRVDPSKPAPTMTTACINPSKGRFVHPTEPHGITVRQAARIQTFPDNFVFHGGLIAAGQQIGNAVPVELARLMVSHLVPILSAQRATSREVVSSKNMSAQEGRAA